MSNTGNGFRAVIFDLGGVILGSPLHAIARFEREFDIPPGFVNGVVANSGPQGAWSRLERGELTLESFYPAFEEDCRAAGQTLSARRMMEDVSEAAAPRPAMLAAVGRIRSEGLRTAALTNNWVSEEIGWSGMKPHFDVFVESAVVRMRKPDPRIYQLTCEKLEVEPEQAIFLDDIGGNLKPARALGMHTIKVEEPEPALEALSRALGFSLVAP